MRQKIITIFGGSGFLGRYVAKALAAEGYAIQIVSRYPSRAAEVKVSGAVGQITLLKGDIRKNAEVQAAIAGSWAVVNLVGVLFERRRQSFAAIHAQGAERIAKLARESGVERLIHISALGVDQPSGSHYARSKRNGEKAVQAAFPDVTILRPSIVFGPEDDFFNRFANMARFLPALPLIGGGKTRFQPVYAGDVAEAVRRCLTKPATIGQTYELGGLHIYTFRELLEYILQQTSRSCCLVNIPFPLASLEASILEWFPKPLLTRDQVKLLHIDNVVSSENSLQTLGITPRGIEQIVPTYLARYRKP